MERAAWIIIALLLVSIGASDANADSYTAAFQCTGTCDSLPTAITNPIVFDSITMPIDEAGTPVKVMWEGEELDLTLPSQDQPGDTYTWGANLDDFSPQLVFTSYPVELIFSIQDENTCCTAVARLSGVFVGTTVKPEVADSGTLVFSAPEPSTLILTLAGLGMLAVVIVMSNQNAQISPRRLV